MNAVKIYGAPTSRFEYFKYKLTDYLEENGIDVTIEEINSIEKLIEDKVASVPTLRINEHIDLSYDDSESIETFIANSIHTIISEVAPEKLTKILVPIDFSDVSLNAFVYASEMAKDIRGEIDLLYVNHPSPVVVNGVVVEENFTKNDKIQQLENIAKTGIGEKEREYFDDDLYWMKPVYKEGLAGDEILIASEDMDIIIMGSTGENNTLKKLIGSISNRVGANAHSPVILVPANCKYTGIDKIVFAYSPTGYDHKALKEVVSIARLYDAEIHLIHVDDGTPYEPYDINTYLTHMYEDINFHHQIISADTICYGITNYADQLEADLIIVSKKKKTLMERLFDKSQSKSTIMKSNIPVMVIHKEDKICKSVGKFKKEKDEDCDD